MKHLSKKVKIIITISFFSGAFLLWIIGYMKDRAMHFNGIVQNVVYDISDRPTVTINGTNYYLDYTNWNLNVRIAKGDNMIKKKGEMNLKLIKHNRRDTIDLLTKW